MPTAERFANRYPSYWGAVFPQLEHFVRVTNLGPKRLEPALGVKFPAHRQALVSETAFMLWAQQGQDHEAEAAARARLAELLDAKQLAPPLVDVEWAVARELARRIGDYARDELHLRDAVVEPRLPGCGAVSGGTPDLLGTARIGGRWLSAIVEIKAVDRTFRSSDFRQVAAYAALLFAARDAIPELFVVMNPLRGTAVEVGVTEFFYDAAHARPDEVLQHLVSEWSEPRLYT